MLPELGGDNRMAFFLKLPFLNFCKACADILGEGAVDRHPGHAVSGAPKLSEIWLELTLSLETCRITRFHVDPEDFLCVII